MSARDDAPYLAKVPSKIFFIGSSTSDKGEQRDDAFQSTTKESMMDTINEDIEVIHEEVTKKAPPTKLKFVSQRLRLMRHWKNNNKNSKNETKQRVVDITQRKSPLKFRRPILKMKNKE